MATKTIKKYKFEKCTCGDAYVCSMKIKENNKIKTVSIQATRNVGEKRSSFEKRLFNYLVSIYGAPVE